jgi:hypothetical protein
LPVIVDGKTLQTAGWAQPVTIAEMTRQPNAQDQPNDMTVFVDPTGGRPAPIPTSNNGRIVTLPKYLLVLTPTYAVAQPYGADNFFDFARVVNRTGATGSLSGLTIVSAMGEIFKGGVKIGDRPPNGSFGGTPCGRYRLTMTFPPSNDSCLEVSLTENGRPLMLGVRFPLLSGFNPTETQNHGRRAVMLGEQGPLAILSDSARALQLTDFNIPAIAKELLPTEFHVVSQPTPCVIEGATMQYQILVNNPAAVRTCRLQTPVPGARISPQGLFVFTAPQRTAKMTQVQISIELIGVDGRSVLHEFPIFILPTPRNSTVGRTPAI